VIKLNPRKRCVSKNGDSSTANYTCFGCGKPGHVKAECPNHQSKETLQDQKGKGKRAYVMQLSLSFGKFDGRQWKTCRNPWRRNGLGMRF